jgi:hypothetical protein
MSTSRERGSSQRLAGVIRISPDGRDLDLDLVEIRLAPLSVKYIATISHSSLVWTEKEIRWNGSELQVAAPSKTEREIIVKPPQDLGWTTNPPSAPVKPATLYGHFCSAVEGKSN